MSKHFKSKFILCLLLVMAMICGNFSFAIPIASITKAYAMVGEGEIPSEKLAIDGNIDEAYWNLDHELTIKRAFYDDNLPVDENMRAIFGTLSDSEYLYFAFDVTDRNVVNQNHTDPWEDDSVDIYIDGNLNKDLYDKNTAHFIFRWNDEDVHMYSENSECVCTTDGILHKAVEKKDENNTILGYTMEIAIPWSSLGLDGMRISKIGFTSHVNNPDANTALKLTENPNGNGNWKDSCGWIELPVKENINIDGNLDEFSWQLKHELSIGKTENTAATLGTLIDNDKLYIGVDVIDSDPINTGHEHPFMDDCVEIYIDGNLAKGKYDAKTVQYIFRFDDESVYRYTSSSAGCDATTDGIIHEFMPTDKGYTVEIGIPWTSLGLDISKIKKIGFTAHVNNSSDTTVQLTVNETGKGNWQDSSGWIELPLSSNQDNGSGDPTDPPETPKEGEIPWNVPEKWYMDAYSGVTELDDTVSYSGDKSVKITGTGLAGQSVVLLKPWQTYSYAPKYRFSVYYKTSGGYNGTPRISVQYLDNWGTPIIPGKEANTGYIYGESGDHDWILLSGEITMPARSCKPVVQFESEGTEGTIWFDDVSICEVMPDGSLSKNKALNPGFETLYSVISDEEFFSKLDLELTELSGVKAAVEAEDYAAARAEYLNYYKTRISPIFNSSRDGEMPEPVLDYDTYNADLAMDHIWNLVYGYDKEYYLGSDISWEAFPPTNDQSWLAYKNMIRDVGDPREDENIILNLMLDKGKTTTGLLDSSRYGNHGYIEGEGSEWTFAKSGDALRIGNGTYIEVEDSNSLDISDNLTIESWFRLDNSISDSYLVHKNEAYSLKAADHNGKPAASVYVDGQWLTITSPETIVSDKWYHAAMTYSSSDKTLKLYINGILKASKTYTDLANYAINTSDSRLAIGCDSSTGSCYFNGIIDELNILNVVKTEFIPSEIPAVNSSTASQFKLDGGIDLQVSDSSQNNNSGIIKGSNYSWVSSKYGGAFKTNGTGYIRVDDSDSLDITKDLRIEGWFKADDINQDSFVVHKGNAYGLKLTDGNGFPTAQVYVDGQWRTAASTEAVQPGRWYNLGMIYSTSRQELKLYVDGILKATTKLSGLSSYAINSSSDWLAVGASSQEEGMIFDGSIDRIRMTKTADKYFGTSMSPFICAGLLDDAYWYTGDEKYAQELIDTMIDWIKDNHYREKEFFNDANWNGYAYKNSTGPSYWNTLMTASRLNNMVWHLYCVRKSESLTPDKFISIMKSLYEHQADLNIRISPTGNDAIVTSTYGYKFAVMHPEFKESQAWRDFFINRLDGFLKTIVYPDGVEDELAPGYHVYVEQSYSGMLGLANANGFDVPQSFRNNLEKMYEFTMDCVKPDGTMPQFSDTDAGYLRYEIYNGYKLFDREDMRYVGSGGNEGTEPEHASVGYDYGGFYFMRSGWGADDNYLAFDGGHLGTAHVHQDKLTFELSAYGKNLIVDSGKMTYNIDKWREYVVSSASHNVMLVDGKGQYRTYSPSAVAPVPVTDTKFMTSKYFDFVSGIYNDGYGNEKDKSVSHERNIFFAKPGYWIFHDVANVTSGEHVIDELFQFAPMKVIIDEKTKAAYTDNIGEANLRIIPVDIDGLEVDVTEGMEDPVRGWVSPEYGEKDPAPQVKYTRNNVNSNTSFDFVLYPTEPGIDSEINVERLPVERRGKVLSTDIASAIKVSASHKGVNDYILISDTDPEKAEKTFGTSNKDQIKTDAEIAFVSLDAATNEAKTVTLVNGRNLSDNNNYRIKITSSKAENYITVNFLDDTLEIFTDLDLNGSDSVRIKADGITNVTVNGENVEFKAAGTNVFIGKN